MRKEWNATHHENAYAVPGRWTAVELVPSIAVWFGDLRVCDRQGHDSGEANGRKGQAFCTFNDHDHSPPCVVITALNSTVPRDSTVPRAVPPAGCGKNKLSVGVCNDGSKVP